MRSANPCLILAAVLSLSAGASAVAADAPNTMGNPKTPSASTGPMSGTDSSQTTPSVKGAGSAGFAALDVDKDGRISKTEAQKDPQLLAGFDRSDENKDGKIDQAEFARSTASAAPTQATPTAK